MKALLDTNVFLEIILSQEKAEEAKELLLKAGQHEFFMTDYYYNAKCRVKSAN